ncbi:MAG: DNA repair protein RecO [Bacteroidales bacterium]|nr:DNA repair protein RecO [Bacteroidales bacterium]
MPPIHSSSAIILKTVQYNDSSLIINVYSKIFGLIGLLARGVHTTKSKHSAALFQPLNLVEIVFSENKKSNLFSLKEISLEHPYQTIPFNFYKSSILMFINEILYKTLKEEQPNTLLFNYIQQSLLLLDSSTEQYSNFHLYFLAGLTKLLGFAPNFNQEGAWFDLSEGVCLESPPNHQYFITQESKALFHDLFDQLLPQYRPIKLDNTQRRQLLDSLLIYYELHFPGFNEIKSKAILHEIING